MVVARMKKKTKTTRAAARTGSGKKPKVHCIVCACEQVHLSAEEAAAFTVAYYMKLNGARLQDICEEHRALVRVARTAQSAVGIGA